MNTSIKNIQLNHHSMLAMNSQLDMVLWGIDTSIAHTVIKSIVEQVEQLELVISRYDERAELFELNQKAFSQPVKMSQQLSEVIGLGAQYFQQTGGYFDIFNGTVYHTWKSGNTLNSNDLANEQHRVSINKKEQSMRFLQPNVSIDFGGMGKGLALYYANQLLTDYKIKNAFLSFGGSSVLTRGRHPHGEYWPFSLSNNSDKVWKLNNAALSVSKSNREVKQGVAAHILNPKSGEAITTTKTVVVEAQNPIVAEVLSTALIAAPKNQYTSILSSFQHIQYQIIE